MGIVTSDSSIDERLAKVPLVDPSTISPYVLRAPEWQAVGPEPAVRAALDQLIHAYSYAWDARQPKETAALFTEDADVSFFLNGAAEATHRTVGRTKLFEEMSARTAMLKKWRIETRHFMAHNLYGPDDGDMIQVTTMAMIYWQRMPEHPQPQPVQTGFYKSWISLKGNSPRFSKRETHMTGVFHPREVFEQPGGEDV